MEIKEKKSTQLGINYVYLPKRKVFVCENGVIFTLGEYKKGIDLKTELEKRLAEGKLYDYDYARKTGELRLEQDKTVNSTKGQYTLYVIIGLLAFTSVISMYISTLHTATYLADYTDILSAWLMSASVTAYNGTAFEVSVIFRKKKRFGLVTVFLSLWTIVTLFSMATTVSVFYDRFSFNEEKLAEDNKTLDSSRLSLEILQKKEESLREAIEFKKKDIEYRQEKEYATTAVRNELNVLQNELQKNLSEQQQIMSITPEAGSQNIKRKESLFSFLGRLCHTEGSILEFIMSTLSAIFVNLIAPLSLTAVVELMYKRELDKIN